MEIEFQKQPSCVPLGCPILGLVAKVMGLADSQIWGVNGPRARWDTLKSITIFVIGAEATSSSSSQSLAEWRRDMKAAGF